MEYLFILLVVFFLIIAVLRLNKSNNHSKVEEDSPTMSEDLVAEYNKGENNVGVCDTPLDEKYTPETITHLGRRDIFVFGYGVRGHHIGSDARIALHRFGAVIGGTDGLYGNSYAIPIGWNFDSIKPYIDKFIKYAEYEKALTFYVTKIGCEWYDIRIIAPLFRNAYNLPNVILPIEFAACIENETHSALPQRILDAIDATHKERVKHFDTPIKVIGIGGGGTNSVERMIENPLTYVEYSVLITDNQVEQSKIKFKACLYDSDPCGINSMSTEEGFNRHYSNTANNSLVNSLIDSSAKHVIIVAGFGGATGTLGSKWLVSLCKKVNVPMTVVCTIPFDFEGEKQQRALEAANSLKEEGVSLKVLKAEDLMQKYHDISFFDCFSLLDEYVAETVSEICKGLEVSQKEDEDKVYPMINKLPNEITTHCYGMTRTFADIILSLNEEKKYSSPDQALSDLGVYLSRYKERGDNVAFLSVRLLKCILNEADLEIFRDGVLNTDRLRELLFQDKYIHSKIDEAYVLYCKEKLMNLVVYLNEFRRYATPEAVRKDLFENTDVLQFPACAPIKGFYYFVMSGATDMNYPVQFFIRAIRNLWPEIITDGVLDATKMRKLMCGNHDESVKQYGLEATIQRDYIEDSPCHPEVFVPKVMGTAPIYVKDVATGRYMRSCGEGKGPNSIPDWLEFQIAKQILEKDKSYKLIGHYYIPKDDNTLPVYGKYSGRIVFNTHAEKLKFIEDVKLEKRI